MPVTIEIPTAFRRFTDGVPKVDCSANTIAEALAELTARFFPELSRHVRDDSGQIRQFPQRLSERGRHSLPRRRVLLRQRGRPRACWSRRLPAAQSHRAHLGLSPRCCSSVELLRGTSLHLLRLLE